MHKLGETMMALVVCAGVADAAYMTIGTPGNDDDTRVGYGGVGYTYNINDHEVTIGEFMESGAGDGDENYWNSGPRSLGTDAPAVNVTLYEAMKYCNWLTSGNTDMGAYLFSGGVYQSTDRDAAIAAYGTVYAIPTEDEWYKAAYYNMADNSYSDYANGGIGTAQAPTDTVSTDNTGWNYDGVNTGSRGEPWLVGSSALEQNGTYDMAGNVSEWVEESYYRGGAYYDREKNLRYSARTSLLPISERAHIGFRTVEIVPEPVAVVLVAGGGALLIFLNRLFGLG